MEPEDRIHDHGKPGKSSRSEVDELREVITTGMHIINDAASPQGDTDVDGIVGEAMEALGTLCERALSGDQKSLSQLRKIAHRVVLDAGSLGAASHAGDAQTTSSKSRRGTGRKRRAAARKSEKTLPDHPLASIDLPESLPEISLHEIGEFVQARNTFLLARADYERRRTELIYKLRMLCVPEDRSNTADYLLKLDGDGDTLIVTDQTSIPVETIIDRR